MAVWPVDLTLQSYQFLLENPAFGKSFLVTLLHVLAGVPVNMVLTDPGGDRQFTLVVKRVVAEHDKVTTRTANAETKIKPRCRTFGSVRSSKEFINGPRGRPCYIREYIIIPIEIVTYKQVYSAEKN